MKRRHFMLLDCGSKSQIYHLNYFHSVGAAPSLMAQQNVQMVDGCLTQEKSIIKKKHVSKTSSTKWHLMTVHLIQS